MISRTRQTRRGHPGRMDSPRRGDPISTESAFEGIPRGNATIVARFLHCDSCQKSWVGRAEGTGTTGLRYNIQKCLREHTEGVGEYQFEQSRKIISERKRRPSRHCQYAENAAWMRIYLSDENKFCAWGLFGQRRTQPICEKLCTSSSIRA